jgi:hypothetical protein
MTSVDKAIETQLANIEKRTGKTLAQLKAVVKKSGLTKHGEIRDLLKRELGMGHGDANRVALEYLQSSTETRTSATGPSPDAVLDEIYSGAKAGLRPIHVAAMTAINKLGAFEIAPKKGYVSLRRKKQFAMLGPGTKGRVELGLNMKGIAPTERLIAQAPGGMCQYKVFLSNVKEVDRELIGWIKIAFDNAGL